MSASMGCRRRVAVWQPTISGAGTLKLALEGCTPPPVVKKRGRWWPDHFSELAAAMSESGLPLPSATGFTISNPCPNLHGYLPCRASTAPMALRATQQARWPQAHLRQIIGVVETRVRSNSGGPGSKRWPVGFQDTPKVRTPAVDPTCRARRLRIASCCKCRSRAARSLSGAGASSRSRRCGG